MRTSAETLNRHEAPLRGSHQLSGANRGTVRRHASCVLVMSLAAPLLLGCTVEMSDPEGVSNEESAVIGGSTLSIGNRRSLGLVDVASPGVACSGILVAPSMVLTATHCLDLAAPSNNTFSAPRTNGGMDIRSGGVVSRVGTTDISLVSLQTPNVVQQWPSVSRTVVRSPTESALVNQSVACYGRGASGYASPSGLIADGLWRILNTTFAALADGDFRIDGVAGNQILAPGDSGGPCLYGSQIASVSSHATIDCVDETTTLTCKNTATKVVSDFVASTQPYADYIDFAASRKAVTFVPLTLAPGWTNAPYSTNNAGYAYFDGAVHLRGAIATSGTNPVAFTLPGTARPSADVYVPIDICGGRKGRLRIQPDGTTSVQTVAGGWLDAQCFTSLEGASFVRSTAFDTQLSLQNGWVGAPYSTRAPAAKLTSGVVRLAGSLAWGTAPEAFTLPAGFRPATRTYLPVDLCNATKGRLIIEPTGQTFVAAEGNFSDAQCFTSLDGVTFVVANNGNLPPLNGWAGAPYSTRAPGVTNILGIVRFQGAVATNGSNPQILQLGAADRPATMVYVPVDLCAGATGRLVIYPDGRVYVQSASTFGKATCFTSLEGASFGI